MSLWGRWRSARRLRWPCSRGQMRFGYMGEWSPRDARLYRIDEAADHLVDPHEYWDRLFLRAALACLGGDQLAVASAYHPRHLPDRLRHSGAQSMVRACGGSQDAPHRGASVAFGPPGRGPRLDVRYRAFGSRLRRVVAGSQPA